MVTILQNDRKMFKCPNSMMTENFTLKKDENEQKNHIFDIFHFHIDFFVVTFCSRGCKNSETNQKSGCHFFHYCLSKEPSCINILHKCMLGKKNYLGIRLLPIQKQSPGCCLCCLQKKKSH